MIQKLCVFVLCGKYSSSPLFIALTATSFSSRLDEDWIFDVECEKIESVAKKVLCFICLNFPEKGRWEDI